MIDDGRYTGVVDRIEEGVAVVIVEFEGRPVEEFHLGSEDLPEGVTGGSVCRVTLSDGEVDGIDADPTATDERRESARRRFDRLSRRPDDPED
jgi:hypothetical protein